MEYVPLKDRLLKVRPVCRKFSEAVKKSVKSVEFLRDELDYCDDAKIAFLLSVYGKNVEHLNYDLFRSCSLREYTQWSWRQSVISSVTKCTALKQLDILICCRHRLRDGDLAVIFKHCQSLEVLRMDATFVNGNCFSVSVESIVKEKRNYPYCRESWLSRLTSPLLTVKADIYYPRRHLIAENIENFPFFSL